jgi:hypothetical protein
LIISFIVNGIFIITVLCAFFGVLFILYYGVEPAKSHFFLMMSVVIICFICETYSNYIFEKYGYKNETKLNASIIIYKKHKSLCENIS